MVHGSVNEVLLRTILIITHNNNNNNMNSIQEFIWEISKSCNAVKIWFKVQGSFPNMLFFFSLCEANIAWWQTQTYYRCYLQRCHVLWLKEYSLKWLWAHTWTPCPTFINLHLEISCRFKKSIQTIVEQKMNFVLENFNKFGLKFMSV